MLKTNEVISDGCAHCEGYKYRVQDILQTCHRYSSPFGKTCSLVKQKWQKQLLKAGVHERFWNANFACIEKRGIPERINGAFAKIESYCRYLKNRLNRGEGLVLKGPVGTMKTTLAVAILQLALWQGYSARKIMMQSLLDEIFSRKAYSLGEWLKFEKDLRECRLLVIDELGKHLSKEWVMTKFEAIVGERHERRRSTIFVTNMTSIELKGLYSEGVIDRFNHVNEVINFSGGSLRVKGD